jgi:hypothetical protein
MNIAEMHVWFRQYAQQMGMQNVRAILPEQIDVFINTAISDLVNQLVRENVGVRNDRVITDNVKIGQINALRSLYKVQEFDLATATPFMEFLAENMLIGKMSNKTAGGSDVSTTVAPDYLYIVDFSINYKVANRGYSGSHGGLEPDIAPITGKLNPSTNYFPVRLIEDAYLADTLNDSILKNRIRTPIIVTYNDGTFDLYIDEFKLDTDGTYYLVNKLIPFKLRFSYIASPAKVKYAKDIGGDNVDCDLPESMHIDILKHAVDLYNVALQGGLYSAQQNQQAQQREMSRNEARPANEGYQN